MSVSSVVLDLAFAWLSRGNTDANVKSTTLVQEPFLSPITSLSSGGEADHKTA